MFRLPVITHGHSVAREMGKDRSNEMGLRKSLAKPNVHVLDGDTETCASIAERFA
jgi:hypothetical protein